MEKNISFKKKNIIDIELLIDRKRINQVLINILHNAIKFSPENQKIEIEMEKTDNYLIINIINKTFININNNEISKFFIKYKHLSDNKEKGSGLGLAISKGIMQAHKGDIIIKTLDKNRIKVSLLLPLNKDSKQ